VASQGPNNGGSASSNPADLSWDADPADAIGEDDTYAFIARNNVFRDTTVRLLYSGSPTGDNKAAASNIDPPDPALYRQYGGAADGWNASLTPAIVNHSTFGLLVQWTDNSDESLTDELLITNFGFTVPGTATINGVLAETRLGPNNVGDFYPGIDNVRMTVHYTEASGATGQVAATPLFGF
jgi:hypothetical protein